jgi:hypothetical protein
MDSDPNTPFQYNSGGNTDSGAAADPANPQPNSPQGNVTWSAAEYIEHERGTGWYLALLLITAAIAVGFYFVTKDYFAVGTAVVVGVIVAIAARKKPRQINYEVSSKGLRIGEKLYAYNMFKSFSVAREDGMNSVNLIPLKRFMPIVSAYFAPQDEEQIVNAIGEHLPVEEHKLDNVDRLARRLRF